MRTRRITRRQRRAGADGKVAADVRRAAQGRAAGDGDVAIDGQQRGCVGGAERQSSTAVDVHIAADIAEHGKRGEVRRQGGRIGGHRKVAAAADLGAGLEDTTRRGDFHGERAAFEADRTTGAVERQDQTGRIQGGAQGALLDDVRAKDRVGQGAAGEDRRGGEIQGAIAEFDQFGGAGVAGHDTGVGRIDARTDHHAEAGEPGAVGRQIDLPEVADVEAEAAAEHGDGVRRVERRRSNARKGERGAGVAQHAGSLDDEVRGASQVAGKDAVDRLGETEGPARGGRAEVEDRAGRAGDAGDVGQGRHIQGDVRAQVGRGHARLGVGEDGPRHAGHIRTEVEDAAARDLADGRGHEGADPAIVGQRQAERGAGSDDRGEEILLAQTTVRQAQLAGLDVEAEVVRGRGQFDDAGAGLADGADAEAGLVDLRAQDGIGEGHRGAGGRVVERDIAVRADVEVGRGEAGGGADELARGHDDGVEAVRARGGREGQGARAGLEDGAIGDTRGLLETAGEAVVADRIDLQGDDRTGVTEDDRRTGFAGQVTERLVGAVLDVEHGGAPEVDGGDGLDRQRVRVAEQVVGDEVGRARVGAEGAGEGGGRRVQRQRTDAFLDDGAGADEDAGGGQVVGHLQRAAGGRGEGGRKRQFPGDEIDAGDGRTLGDARADDDLAGGQPGDIGDDEAIGADGTARHGLVELDVEPGGRAGENGDVARRRAGPTGRGEERAGAHQGAAGMGEGTARGQDLGAGPDLELADAGNGAGVGHVDGRGQHEVRQHAEVASGRLGQVRAQGDAGQAGDHARRGGLERVAQGDAGVRRDRGDGRVEGDAEAGDDLAHGEAGGVGHGQDGIPGGDGPGDGARTRGEDAGDRGARGDARADDDLADGQAGHIDQGDAVRGAGAAQDAQGKRIEDRRTVGGQGRHLQPAGLHGRGAGVRRLADDDAGRELKVAFAALDEAAGADDRRRESALGEIGDGVVGIVDRDGEHARGGGQEVLGVPERSLVRARGPDEVEGAAGDLDAAGEVGAGAAEVEIFVADLDQRAGTDQAAVEGTGRREGELGGGGRSDVATDAGTDGDAAEVKRGQLGHRQVAGVELVKLGGAERQGADVDGADAEDGEILVQRGRDERRAQLDAGQAGDGAGRDAGERLAQGEVVAGDRGDHGVGGDAGAGDDLADGEAAGVRGGERGETGGDGAGDGGGAGRDDLRDVGAAVERGPADDLADADIGDRAQRQRGGPKLTRHARRLDRQGLHGQDRVELRGGPEVVGEERVRALQGGGEGGRPRGRVAHGQAARAEVDEGTGRAEEGAHDLVLVTLRVGAGADEHEGRGVGRGVGGAGDQGAARTDDGRAVVGVLEEVGAGGARQGEAGGALLDQAADAGDEAGVSQASVLLQRDVAAAELDARGGVARQVADELVGVAEPEHGLAGGAGVERDGGGVDERVVPAAGEGKVDAVVDEDAAAELVLRVDDVELAGVEARIDLDAGAAAVVEHRRGQQLEGRARGAREVGGKRAGVVLQDGEGAVVADEDLLLAQALRVGDERPAQDQGLIVGGTAGEQEHEGARAGLHDAAAGHVVDGIVAEDVAGEEAVPARVLVDGEGVAVEAQGGAHAGAGDDELVLVAHVGGGAHGVHRGVDLGVSPADVGRALGAQREVGLEVADRLIVAEDDLGARVRVGDELARAIPLDGEGAGVGEERGAVVPARVVVGIGGDLRVADVGAAAGEAEGSLGLLGAVEVGGVLGAGDVEGTAVGEGEAGGRLQDDRAARRDEIARHPRIVEDAQGARAGLDDLAAAGEDADRPDEVLVDVDAEAVARVGTGGDGGLELVVVVAGLEVVGEVQAQPADVGRGVGEAEFGRAVQDDAAHAGHAFGEGVGDAVGVGDGEGDVVDERGDLEGGEDLALHAGAVVVPHVEVAADHEQAGVDLDAALQAGEAPVVAVGGVGGRDVGAEVDGPQAVDVIGARVREEEAQRSLDVRIRERDGVVEHAAGAALVLQDTAARLAEVAIAAEGAGDRRGDQVLEDGDRARVGDGDAVRRGGVAQDDERLGVRGQHRGGGGEGDGAQLQRAVRRGEVGGEGRRTDEIDVREIGGGGLGGHRGVERPRQQTVAAAEEAQGLRLTGDVARVVEDIDGLRRVGSLGRFGEDGTVVLEGQRGGVRQAGARDQRVAGHGGRGPVVMRRRAGPAFPGPRAAQGGPHPGGPGDVLLGLGEACGRKRSRGHQQRFRDPHGVGGARG